MMILGAGSGKIVHVQTIRYVHASAFSPLEAGRNADGRQIRRPYIRNLLTPAISMRPVITSGARRVEVYAKAVESVWKRSALGRTDCCDGRRFIRYDELQSLVSETNTVCGGDWPYGNGLAPIAINGTPRASGAEYALVLEGFEALTRGRRRRKVMGDRGGSQEEVAERPLPERDEDRFHVHWIAGKIWTSHPRMSIEGILRMPEIAAYLRKWAPNTVRAWLSAVDPRPALSKPGRRHKTKKK